MSTQDLVYNLPKLRTRPLRRKIAVARLKARRYIKLKARRTHSKAVATYRRQYFLAAAGRDFRTAVAKNEDIFITSVIVSAVLAYCFATTVTDLLLLFFQTALDGTTRFGLGMLPLSIAALGTLCILGVWTTAFMLNNMSIAIMEGATNKQHRSVRKTLRHGLRRAGRVSAVWLLLAFRLGLVLAVVGTASFAAIAVMGLNTIDDVLRYSPYAGGVAALGMLYVLLRNSLAPYVALFEFNVSYRETFKRSQHLLRRRGKLFLLAAYLAASVAAASMYAGAVLVEELLGINRLVLCLLGLFSITIILNGILVALYRKRKLARKY